ncbi:hypothetical protein [Mycobacterium vicinigordonae]|nr:hypothetical protein [Mycobacterium vicinigordonae]
MDVEAIADIVAGKTVGHGREVIVTCPQELAANESGEYGYLT